MMTMMMMMTMILTTVYEIRLSPSKVNSGHLVELNVKRPIEPSESLQHIVVYRRMRSAFRLAETTRRSVVIIYVEFLLQGVPVPQSSSPSTATVPKAREALGRVQIKVAVVDNRRKSEEVLKRRQLADRVRDEAFSADEVESLQGEVTQPAVEVTRVQADLHRSPGRVDRHCRR